MNIARKRVLITGANRDIGQALSAIPITSLTCDGVN
jgi:short-subunit dehydrogenase